MQKVDGFTGDKEGQRGKIDIGHRGVKLFSSQQFSQGVVNCQEQRLPIMLVFDSYWGNITLNHLLDLIALLVFFLSNRNLCINVTLKLACDICRSCIHASVMGKVITLSYISKNPNFPWKCLKFSFLFIVAFFSKQEALPLLYISRQVR